MFSAHRPPTILQVLPEMRAGGVERGTIEIAAAIVKAGGRALVASQGGQLLPMLAYVGAEHITLPLKSKNPFTMLKNRDRLLEVIRKQRVDIVHARSRAPAWSAYWATQISKTPFVTTFHGVYGLQNKWKKKYNAIMTKGDRVIAISHFIAEHIQKNYPIDPAKLRIIHRGVDLKQFDAARIIPQRLADLTKSWRLTEEGKVILMPGRFTRWKGQDVLVRALALLPRRDFTCLLVGDDMGHPQYRLEVEGLIVSLGLSGHVRVAANTPHMAEALTLSDLVVVPSVEPEAFGRVPIEAQAMGKPIISTNHGGACETVVPGETGWLVEPGNAQQLADAITEALSMPEEKKEWMAENCRWNARENFSAEVMCAKTLEVYAELLKR